VIPASSTRPVSLEDVLRYRHPAVVQRYATEQHASPAEAEDVFHAMLKWLYLCYRSMIASPEAVGCAMTVEIAKIDDMWHTFILFTRDYAEFCDRYFGVFVHHTPTPEETVEPERRPQDFRRLLEGQLGLIYDVLGEDTLVSWYESGRFAKPVKRRPVKSGREITRYK
jgi:hypothetical protein